MEFGLKSNLAIKIVSILRVTSCVISVEPVTKHFTHSLHKVFARGNFSSVIAVERDMPHAYFKQKEKLYSYVGME